MTAEDSNRISKLVAQATQGDQASVGELMELKFLQYGPLPSMATGRKFAVRRGRAI